MQKRTDVVFVFRDYANCIELNDLGDEATPPQTSHGITYLQNRPYRKKRPGAFGRLDSPTMVSFTGFHFIHLCTLKFQFFKYFRRFEVHPSPPSLSSRIRASDMLLRAGLASLSTRRILVLVFQIRALALAATEHRNVTCCQELDPGISANRDFDDIDQTTGARRFTIGKNTPGAHHPARDVGSLCTKFLSVPNRL